MNFKEEILRLKTQDPFEDANYYAVSIFSLDGKKPNYAVQSNWAGFSEEKPIREIREASLVKPKILKQIYIDIGEPALIINTEFDFKIFILYGGHSIMEESIAQKYCSDFLKPNIVVTSLENNYGKSGFQNVDSVAPQKLNKAPSAKLRMKILKRDEYRCRICGRSPKNYVDIELHLHHIKPYNNFGLTEEENLITLCHTCHNGLEPHFDWNLFDFIGTNSLGVYIGKDHKEKFVESVKNYQKIVRENLFKNQKKKSNS